MADSLKPPLFNDDDDDNEDLFVSAIENHSKQSGGGGGASGDNTIKSSSTTMEDLNIDSVGDEIDLNDDDEEDADQHRTPTKDQSAAKEQSQSADDFDKQFGFLSPSESTKSTGGVTLQNGDSEKPKNQSPSVATLDTVVTPQMAKATIGTSSATTLSGTPAAIKTSSSGPKPIGQSSTNKNEPVDTVASGEHFIEIKIDEPQKVGEGMGSFVVYKVTTKTNLPYFRKQFFSVNRRFSDFLGLRDKLAEKHLHLGRIVPPAPEKSAMGTAKIKMSKEDTLAAGDFIEKRRASLERFLIRTGAHPNLRVDPDFREFLELNTDLPKASGTSAISGAGVRRLFNRMGDNLNKMTFRMDESDPWFEEKQHQVENLDMQLRKLYASVEALIHHRRELTMTTGQFAKSAAMLGNCEEHTSLSCALSQLADTEEKIEQLYLDQSNSDFYLLSELLKDYINLIGSVRDIFHQRVKVYQTWQHAQQMLTRKREQKARLELAGKSDKVSAAAEEVTEWDAKVERGQEEFESISRTIKSEMDRFEIGRIRDFKSNIIKYMESLLDTQQKLIKYWEAFLPEAKAIA